jgi:plastocyanin
MAARKDEDMKQASICRHGLKIAALALGLLVGTVAARAEDAVTVNISIKGHRFQPAESHAPAGKPITIILKNLDPAPAEFESNMLRVEKVVTGGGTVTMRIRPLAPGRYRFFDDFHPEAEGYLVVK